VPGQGSGEWRSGGISGSTRCAWRWPSQNLPAADIVKRRMDMHLIASMGIGRQNGNRLDLAGLIYQGHRQLVFAPGARLQGAPERQGRRHRPARKIPVARAQDRIPAVASGSTSTCPPCRQSLPESPGAVIGPVAPLPARARTSLRPNLGLRLRSSKAHVGDMERWQPSRLRFRSRLCGGSAGQKAQLLVDRRAGSAGAGQQPVQRDQHRSPRSGQSRGASRSPRSRQAFRTNHVRGRRRLRPGSEATASLVARFFFALTSPTPTRVDNDFDGIPDVYDTCRIKPKTATASGTTTAARMSTNDNDGVPRRRR